MESFQTDLRFKDNPKHSTDEHYSEESRVKIPHSSSLTPVKIKRRVIVIFHLVQLSQAKKIDIRERILVVG